MQSRPQQGTIAFSDWFAKAQFYAFFFRSYNEKTRTKEDGHQDHHHEADDGEAATQRLGQRLRAGIHRAGMRGGRREGIGIRIHAAYLLFRLVR